MVIGASSAYFHATLSLVGQLLDEVAILWVLLAGYALWTPEWMIQYTGVFKSRWEYWSIKFPFSTRKSHLLLLYRNGFKLATVVVAMVATSLGFVYPAANAVALMMLGAPCVPILWKEIQRLARLLIIIHSSSEVNCKYLIVLIFRCKSTKVVKLAYIGILWWFVAVTLWLSDRLLCDIWKYLSVPYFHCGWHVFILLGSNIGCVLGCYFYARSEHKELNSELSFWPARLGTWGLPYIAVRKKPLQKQT